MSSTLASAKISRRTSLVWTAASASAWFSGAALARTTASSIDVQHARGTTPVPAHPRRVVAYDLAALDILQSLQLPVAGVPRADYPAYLKRYADHQKYPVAGSLFEPDYDALSRLRPDLVIGSIRGNVATRIAQVEAGEFDATLLAAAGLPPFNGVPWRLMLPPVACRIP